MLAKQDIVRVVYIYACDTHHTVTPGDTGARTGPIVGGVVGGFLVVIVIILIAVFLLIIIARTQKGKAYASKFAVLVLSYQSLQPHGFIRIFTDLYL